MGARQSYLNIFLESIDKTYGDGIENQVGYKVISAKAVFDQCDNFEVVTHKIEITKGDAMSYDIYIYNSISVPSDVSYIFAYCSPGVPTHVAKEVKAYYSILSPHTPLAISFVRDKGEVFHCSTSKLKEAGWDWASSISKYSDSNLSDLLQKQFTDLSWDYTIQVTEGNENVNIMGRKMEIDNAYFYRVILVPKKGDGILGLKCMYCLDPPNLKVVCDKPPSGKETQIDTYFLNGILKNFYYGIVMYFARENPISIDDKGKLDHEKDFNNMLLFVEFCNKCGNKCLKRMDKDGCWWTEGKLRYNDYNGRVQELKNIKEGAVSNKSNTVILDKYDNYICGRMVDAVKDKDTYNKYTHKYDESQTPNLLFKRADPGIAILKNADIKAKTIDVYYLKAAGKDDDKPFLLVFDKDGDGKTRKVYHFTESREFKDWEEFKTVEKLDDKLEKISTRGKCTPEFHLLRQLVYRILTKDDIDEISKPTVTVEEKRPEVDPLPPVPPEPPNWLLIIGSSVGAFVFVCLLALAYGIYWYNTTIKLLT